MRPTRTGSCWAAARGASGDVMQAATRIKASQNHFLRLFISSLLLIAQGTAPEWTRTFDSELIHSRLLSCAAGQKSVFK
jgi:hypothetical protein